MLSVPKQQLKHILVTHIKFRIPQGFTSKRAPFLWRRTKDGKFDNRKNVWVSSEQKRLWEVRQRSMWSHGSQRDIIILKETRSYPKWILILGKNPHVRNSILWRRGIQFQHFGSSRTFPSHAQLWDGVFSRSALVRRGRRGTIPMRNDTFDLLGMTPKTVSQKQVWWGIFYWLFRTLEVQKHYWSNVCLPSLNSLVSFSSLWLFSFQLNI